MLLPIETPDENRTIGARRLRSRRVERARITPSFLTAKGAAMNGRLLKSFCFLLVLCSAAWGQDQNQNDDAQIREAVRRGVLFLKAQQNADGGWTYGGHDLGMTAP